MKDNIFHFIELTNINDDTNNTIQIIGIEQIFFSEYNENGKRENYNHYIYSLCKKK